MKASNAIVAGLVSALALAEPAHAYVGPGAGLSLVGALVGLLLTVLTALFFVVSWPLRKLIRKRPAESAGERIESSDA